MALKHFSCITVCVLYYFDGFVTSCRYTASSWGISWTSSLGSIMLSIPARHVFTFTP